VQPRAEAIVVLSVVSAVTAATKSIIWKAGALAVISVLVAIYGHRPLKVKTLMLLLLLLLRSLERKLTQREGIRALSRIKPVRRLWLIVSKRVVGWMW